MLAVAVGTTLLVLNRSPDEPAAAPGQGQEIAFASGPSPPITDDETAFFFGAHGDRDIYVMHADGSGRARITDLPGDEAWPDWSPDGTRITFTHDNSIWLVNADGSEVQDLGARGWQSAWSPDGNAIAYSREDGVWMMKADGTGARKIVAGGSEPAWSPDGNRIAYSNSTGFLPGDDGIWVAEADGSGATRLTDPPEEVGTWTDNSPAWSPDGTTIAFVRADPDGVRTDIWSVRQDGGDLRPLTTAADFYEVHMDPAWTADGTRILMTRRPAHADHADLFVIAADGSDLIQLTKTGESEWQAAWRPTARTTGVFTPPALPPGVPSESELAAALLDPSTAGPEWVVEEGVGLLEICGARHPLELAAAEAQVWLRDQSSGRAVFEHLSAYEPGGAEATLRTAEDVLRPCLSGQTEIVHETEQGQITWRFEDPGIPAVGDDLVSARMSTRLGSDLLVVDIVLVRIGKVVVYVEHGGPPEFSPDETHRLVLLAVQKITDSGIPTGG